jgi:hypothetical protein
MLEAVGRDRPAEPSRIIQGAPTAIAGDILDTGNAFVRVAGLVRFAERYGDD